MGEHRGKLGRYRPYMAEDIQRVTKWNKVCELDGQPKKESLMKYLPTHLCGKSGVDLFHCKGRNYYILVDYHSDFLEFTD